MKAIKRIYRKLFVECSPLQGYFAHLWHGIANVFMAIFVCWSIALLFGGGYCLFQYWQKFQGHKVDADDIAGWLLGIAIGSVAYFVFW